MSEQILVSAAEAAKALGMARSTLYRIASAGLVPSYGVGMKAGGRRFNVQEVREALKVPSTHQKGGINGSANHEIKEGLMCA